jgi:hypothetical protein
MATTPLITDVYPASGARGIPIGDQLRVTFDQEMDEDSINTGTFVLTGPDEAPVFGPVDVTPFDEPGFDDEDILSSPYFAGYVKGTISFSRVDPSGGLVDDSVTDTTGDGTLWQTVAIFTPEKPLKPNVEYTVIVLGDDEPADGLDSGVRTRTVFDTVFTGSGTGRLSFYGGYTGETIRSYTLEITTGGATGDAEYIWWNDNDPLTTYQGITTTGSRELEDGIYVICEPDGSFTAGDKFQVVVVPAIALLNTYRWSFNTGSGAIIVPPSTSSASGIAELELLAGGLQIVSATPKNMSANMDPDSFTEIVIEFNKDVDATSVTDLTLMTRAEPVNGIYDDNTIEYTDPLETTVTVSGATITIAITADQLYENNIVYLTMLSSIAATDGDTLGRDTYYYFTTSYNPMFSSIRRVRLDMGSFIANVPDEAIYLALFEASLQANENALYTSTITNGSLYLMAKREYTTCMAELILAKALLGNSGVSERMSKSLGDLAVSRGGNLSGLKEALAKFEDCAVRWEITLQSGGDIGPGMSLRPQVSIKGAWAEDAIVVGRQWEPTSGIGVNSHAGGNDYTYASGRRDLKTFRSRN